MKGIMKRSVFKKIGSYSLRPEILVLQMVVSRLILVLDTSHFIHFDDNYFRTEGVLHIYTENTQKAATCIRNSGESW